MSATAIPKTEEKTEPVRVVRADPNCTSCEGSGWTPEPSVEVQEAEAEEGKRKFLTKKQCPCVKESW